MGIFNIFSKKQQKVELDKGLEKTRTNVFNKLSKAVIGKSKIDDEVWFFIGREARAKNILSNFRTSCIFNFILY